MIHLRDSLVHLNKAGSRLSASDSNKTFLDDSAVIKLYKKKKAN